MGMVLQQVEKLFPILVPKGVPLGLTYGNMEGNHHQVVLGNELKVVLDELQLIFPEPAPISPAVAWVRIQYIVQDQKMDLSIVECIIGRSKMGFIGFVRKAIFLHIKVEVVVPQ